MLINKESDGECLIAPHRVIRWRDEPCQTTWIYSETTIICLYILTLNNNHVFRNELSTLQTGCARAHLKNRRRKRWWVIFEISEWPQIKREIICWRNALMWAAVTQIPAFNYKRRKQRFRCYFCCQCDNWCLSPSIKISCPSHRMQGKCWHYHLPKEKACSNWAFAWVMGQNWFFFLKKR